MNESTMLLGEVTDHITPTESDMFLQIAESPWPFISGRALFLIRTSLTIIMVSVLAVYLMFEVFAGDGEIFVFRLMNLAWVQQCIYMWLTSYWTYLSAVSAESCRHPYAVLCRRHLAYSANGSLFTARNLYYGCLFRMSSFPTERNMWFFSLFHTYYTSTMVIPFASTILYFAVLRHKAPVVLLEMVMNTLNIGIALVELIFLNSVSVSSSRRDQRRMLVQTVNLALLAVGYCKVWVWIGNYIVHGPVEELDWRLFGSGRKAVNVVVGAYAALWMLELAKGWILKWRRGMVVLCDGEYISGETLGGSV